ncbi:pyrroline-5-carboxylate reductase [Erysipelothrix sp. HDW6C]|uniref:pyrroline-5-carboxylate reductase n=1 Tax=Erysipelothrix sp. HDW6C TaxID=2714930 RepID=UPI00140CACCD|nr:pyrroline-5-carboxylate reductase [Erysipelothrix sp. HDW6C]QIK69218.1 pyrroline-5-carboxylate reductase [Erysipelothrix sp. HDW6C]
MKIGFIGIGNMAQAIIQGMPDKNSIVISARTPEDTLFKASKLGVHAASNHEMCVIESDIIVLSVKPEKFPEIIAEIKPFLKGKTIVSIAAKLSLDDITAMTGDIAIVRVMPNLNVAIQKGISAICHNSLTSPEHLNTVRDIFNHLGEIIEIDEAQFSGFSAIGGSSPAFVFKFIDAMAKEGMEEGLSYEETLDIAALAVAGSADYLRISGVDAQILTKRVCSPGGTTIEGVTSLDNNKFESVVREAVRATIDKDKFGTSIIK